VGSSDGEVFKSSSTWEIERAKTANFDPTKIEPVLYRPFDSRHTYYDEKALSCACTSVMNRFIMGDNIGLCFMRQYSYDCEYCYFFPTREIVESRIFVCNRGREQVTPLYLWERDDERTDLIFDGD